MSETTTNLILTHGYWMIAVIVGLESMGIPLPGETTLVTAGIYAGTSHRLNILIVVGAAIFGAVAGDNAGFWIGHRFGYRFVRRYSRVLRVTDARIKIGRYLFQRHGGKVVFFGRFLAGLRTLSALLAGINFMPWWRFWWFNLTGGSVWASLFGFSAYLFGRQLEEVRGWMSMVGLAVAVAAVLVGVLFARHFEAQLEAQAEREFPGKLDDAGTPA